MRMARPAAAGGNAQALLKLVPISGRNEQVIN